MSPAPSDSPPGRKPIPRRTLDRLKDALTSLPGETRRSMVRRLESEKARGASESEVDEVLATIRELDPGRRSFPKRLPTVARLFFTGLEPFLWDLPDTLKQRGRIPRSALQPIWRWFIREVPADVLAAPVERARRRLAVNDTAAAGEIVESMRAKAVAAIATKLERLRSNESEWRSVGVGIQCAHTLDHVSDMVDIIGMLPALRRPDLAGTNTGADGNPFVIPEPILASVAERNRDLLYAEAFARFADAKGAAAALASALTAAGVSEFARHPARIAADIASRELELRCDDLLKTLSGHADEIKDVAHFERIRACCRFIEGLPPAWCLSWSKRMSQAVNALDEKLCLSFEPLASDVLTAFGPCCDPRIVVGPDRERMTAILLKARLARFCESIPQFTRCGERLATVRAAVLGELEKINAQIVRSVTTVKQDRSMALQYLDHAIELTRVVHGDKLADAWRAATLGKLEDDGPPGE